MEINIIDCFISAVGGFLGGIAVSLAGFYLLKGYHILKYRKPKAKREINFMDAGREPQVTEDTEQA